MSKVKSSPCEMLLCSSGTATISQGESCEMLIFSSGTATVSQCKEY